MDFFNQMKFISEDRTFLDCKNWYQFRDMYFNQIGYDWFPKVGTREAIKQAVNKMCFVLTRKQAGVGNARVREVRYVDMPPKVWKAYKQAEADFEVDGDETKWVVVVHSWLAKLTGGIYKGYEHDAKINEVVHLLEEELKDEPVVIWFKHNEEIERVRKRLIKRRISHTVITGEVPARERAVRLESFQKKRVRDRKSVV